MRIEDDNDSLEEADEQKSVREFLEFALRFVEIEEERERKQQESDLSGAYDDL